MAGELVEVAAEAVGAAFDWLFGGNEQGEEQPRPLPETLYEEHGPPPDRITQ